MPVTRQSQFALFVATSKSPQLARPPSTRSWLLNGGRETVKPVGMPNFDADAQSSNCERNVRSCERACDLAGYAAIAWWSWPGRLCNRAVLPRICRSSLMSNINRSSPQVKRVADALEMLGQPLDGEEKARLKAALDSTGGESSIRAIQNVLDARTLIGVEINPESRVKSSAGPARPRLVQNGWSVFLVKVDNQAGVTAELAAESPNAAPLYKQSTGRAEPKTTIRPADVIQRWADISMFNDRPLKRSLSGLRLEYRIIQIYSRDSGKREASISFQCWPGNSGPGFPQRGRHSLYVRPGGKRGSRYPRQRWPAGDGFIYVSRPPWPGLSGAQPAARSRSLLSSPNLSPERRVRRVAARDLSASSSRADRNT